MRSLFALFNRPSVKARLSVEAPPGPSAGLIMLTIAASADQPVGATLRLEAPGSGQPPFEKSLSLDAEPVRFWVAVHGHLLPNGPAPLRLQLRGPGGALVAEQTLSLEVRNEGVVARQVADSLRASGVPLVVDGACDSTIYDYADPALAAWFDRGPEAVEAHLATLQAQGRASAEEIAALRHFATEGYLVMPDVVEADLLDRVNAAIDDAVARKVEGYEWGSSQRMHNLHADYPAIHELWLHRAILRMLSLIFEVPARPCQSLTYVFGSQQEHHQDTIHLTPFPAGRMCGVWTALEDVQPDSGELLVFPRSHRLPRTYMAAFDLPKVTDDDWRPFGDTVVSRWTEMINAAGLAREAYRPKAGTVLIWHENLMHAGGLRVDMARSRRSIVGHYFAEGAIVYFDSSGMPGAVYAGELP